MTNDPAVREIVARCYTDAEVPNRTGTVARGVTNLKRIFGWPDELQLVVNALAATAGDAQAIASADSGSAPLVALVARELALPAVFMRNAPKDYHLSYGGDPATNDARISGELLPHGTSVHVIDDFIHSGATLRAAVQTLRRVGLRVETAAALLGSPPETLAEAFETMGVRVTVLVTSADIADPS